MRERSFLRQILVSSNISLRDPLFPSVDFDVWKPPSGKSVIQKRTRFICVDRKAHFGGARLSLVLLVEEVQVSGEMLTGAATQLSLKLSVRK